MDYVLVLLHTLIHIPPLSSAEVFFDMIFPHLVLRKTPKHTPAVSASRPSVDPASIRQGIYISIVLERVDDRRLSFPLRDVQPTPMQVVDKLKTRRGVESTAVTDLGCPTATARAKAARRVGLC